MTAPLGFEAAESEVQFRLTIPFLESYNIARTVI